MQNVLEETIQQLLLDHVRGGLTKQMACMTIACIEMREDIRQSYCGIARLAGIMLEDVEPQHLQDHDAMLKAIMRAPGTDNVSPFIPHFSFDPSNIIPPMVKKCFGGIDGEILWLSYAPGVMSANSFIKGLTGLKLWRAEPGFSLTRLMLKGENLFLVLKGDVWASNPQTNDYLLVYGDVVVSDSQSPTHYMSGDDSNVIIMTCPYTESIERVELEV